jgi:hypothetical protein
MSNVLTFPLEGLEGALSGIGEELNELAGVRLTRLAGPASLGATTIEVETVFEWPAAGTVYIRGKRYTYTSVTVAPDAFVGMQEILDGVPTPATGIAEDLRDLTAVADGSETFSGIENAKRMLFVGTAEGEFLDVIGRNYGLTRPFGFTDDQYRELIKILAFMPRGTIYAIEQLLDQLVGVGLYTILEDLVNFPNCVFISLANTLSTDAQGAAYFNQKEELTSSNITTVTVTETPIQAARDNVYGVYLQPDLHKSDMNQLPSADPTTAWTYEGDNVEATSVIIDAAGATAAFTDASGTLFGPRYTRPFLSEVETDVYASWVLHSPTATTDQGMNFRIQDGTRSFGVGWDATNVFLYDEVAAARVGGNTAHLGAVPASYRLEKRNGRVRLWQNDILISDEAYTAFLTTANRLVRFGAFSAGGTSSATWSDLNVLALDTEHNYWNQVGTADGTTAIGDPDRLTSSGTLFVQASDVGRRVVVQGSTVSHGRGNGTYETTAVDVGGGWADCQGVTHTATANAEPLDAIDAENVRIPINWDEFSAEDAGLPATLTTGSGTSEIVWTARHGGAIGDNITIQFIHALPATVQVAVVNDGDGLEDLEITLDPLNHTADDVITAINGQADAANLVIASGGGIGAPAILAATNLAGGEDGKTLVLAGSLLGNNGTYKIATLTDARNVLLGDHRTPAALTAETDLDWRKDPNFPTDTGLDWELAAAGTLAGLVLTTRRSMPLATTPVYVLYTTQLSAQILLNEFVSNSPVNTYYPFYLADPFAFIRAFVDDVTVAGVIAKFQE